MPKCPRCGSYFIRPPCPVCSPPGDVQLIEDSKESKGKSIEELQSDLQIIRDSIKEKETELDNLIQDLTLKLNTINDRIENLEISKVAANEKIATFEEEDKARYLVCRPLCNGLK